MGTKLYKVGEVWRGSFSTRGITGAGTVADSLPTGQISKNGTLISTGTVAVTVALLTGNQYGYSLTIPGGYAAGDELDVWITATVGGVTDTDVVDSVRIVAVDATNATNFGLTNFDATIASRMATFALPTNFSALSIGAGGHITNVDTLTTYTGNTPQTGDSFARIGVNGAGLTAINVATILGQVPAMDTVGGALQVDMIFVGGKAATAIGPVNFSQLNSATLNGTTPLIDTITGALGADLLYIRERSVNDPGGSVTVPTSIASATSVSSVQTTLNGIASGATVVRANDAAGAAIAPAGTALSTAVWTAPKAGFIDAAIGSRMATFSLPTNFSALGIGAGGHVLVVDTVSNVTNAVTSTTSLAGPSSVTITFHDANAAVVPNVQMTVVGQGSIAANSSGVATFGLANGTYTVTAAITSGIVFANTTLTVNGTTALTITGTNPVIPAPPSAGQATVYAYAMNGDGSVPACGKTFILSMVSANTGSDAWNGDAYSSTTSDTTTGLASASALLNGTYQASLDGKTWTASFVVNTSPYHLREIVGSFNGTLWR